MYKLLVSYDCGASYVCLQTSESKRELVGKIVACDRQWLRWVMEDENGKIVDTSGIHKVMVNIAIGARRTYAEPVISCR